MVLRRMGQYVAWPPPEELRTLLDRAQHEDAGALERILPALRPPLLAYFAYRLPEDIAEDLTQIALIRMTRAIPRIDPSRADRYVMTIARSLVRTAHRRRSRDTHRCAPPDFVDTAESRGGGACFLRLRTASRLPGTVIGISGPRLWDCLFRKIRPREADTILVEQEPRPRLDSGCRCRWGPQASHPSSARRGRLPCDCWRGIS